MRQARMSGALRFRCIPAGWNIWGRGGADQCLSDLDLSDSRHAADIKRWLAGGVSALRHAVNVLESLLDPETVLAVGMLSNDILVRLIDQAFPL